MKPIVLHPGSVVAGVALACAGLFVASAQVSHVERVLDRPPRVVEHHIVGIYDPRDALVLREEDGDYTVPAGKLFVLTGLGSDDHGSLGLGELTVNGIREVRAIAHDNNGGFLHPASICDVPAGFTVSAGSVISLQFSIPLGRAWGYLIDQ